MSFLLITLALLFFFPQNTATPHLLDTTTLVIIRIHFIFLSLLVIPLIANPGSCDQDPIVLVLYIHDFRECVTRIFSLVMVDDTILDSGILGILVCYQ